MRTIKSTLSGVVDRNVSKDPTELPTTRLDPSKQREALSEAPSAGPRTVLPHSEKASAVVSTVFSNPRNTSAIHPAVLAPSPRPSADVFESAYRSLLPDMRALRHSQVMATSVIAANTVRTLRILSGRLREGVRSKGVRHGEEERTRAFLRSLEAHPVDRATAERAGEIVHELRARGFTVGLAHAPIAATCILRGLTLVTYNLADFEKIAGLAVATVP